MGRGQTGAPGERGITPRSGSILVEFQWQGQRCRETLRLEPTVANIKYASRLRDEITRKIEIGSFQYAEYFPKSKRLKRLGIGPTELGPVPTFTEMSSRWMAASSHLQAGTLKKYSEALSFWISKIGGMHLTEIKFSLIAGLANSQEWGAKHRNNMLIPLRQVLEFAYLDGIIPANPASKIKNAKVQKEPPDPLTAEEVDQVLSYMKRHPEQVSNYFEWAMFTGLRPSETIALQWGDIDWSRKTARVSRAKTFGEMKETKTYKVRDVELTARAVDVLKRQKPHTFLKEHGFVFENPVTGSPYHEERPLRRAYWTPALKALGLRHREMYQCRHTFATLCLMAGANPMWVARQMGHSSMQMLLTVYSRWIDGADKSKEREKMDAAFGKNATGTAQIESGSLESRLDIGRGERI